MATKWRSHRHSTFIWSVIALVMALCSLLYCCTFIFQLIDFSLIKKMARLTRMMIGRV